MLFDDDYDYSQHVRERTSDGAGDVYLADPKDLAKVLVERGELAVSLLSLSLSLFLSLSLSLCPNNALSDVILTLLFRSFISSHRSERCCAWSCRQ